MNPSPIDLAAYLQRIDFDARLAPAPTLETLAGLIQRHAAAIPFENIEVLAGRVPSLDAASLQRKMVQRRRGGYCFEQGGLFGACLAEIGFEVHALEARVRAGVAAGVVTGRTHRALRVTVAGQDHLVDVGFGGLAPLAPLALDDRRPQDAAGSAYRFVDTGDGTLLQVQTEEGWSDCYLIGAGEPHPIDYELANWYVATHPRAMLRSNLLVGRAAPGARMTLFNRQLSLRPAGAGMPQEKQLQSRAEFADCLADGFGLEVEAGDLDRVMEVVARSDAA